MEKQAIKSKKNEIKTVENKKQLADDGKSIFDNKYVPYVIFILFWLIFFRELITGASWLFDDFAHQYFPGKTLLAVSLSKGEFPFWNPYTFAGMPFFADIQIAILYPFNFILSLFVNGDRLAPIWLQLSIIVHYLLMSVFTYWLGRKLQMNNFAATVFSLAFTYSSYMIIHMIHQPLIEAVVWLPLTFLFWLKFLDEKKYLWVFAGALSIVLTILAGYPQVAFFNYFFLAMFTLFVFIAKIREKDFSSVKHIITGFPALVIFPFGITAVQLLATNEFVSLSNRASFDYDFARQGSIHFYDLITFIMPKYFGVWNWNDTAGEMQWWARHQEGPWMFSVANIYISALVVVLLIPVIRYLYAKKENLLLLNFLIGFSVFAVLFALGGNFFFHKLLFDFVPVFNRFRNPGHILYLFSFPVSIILGLGISKITEDKNGFKKYLDKKYLFIISGIFILLLIMYAGGMFKSGELLSKEQIYSWVTNQYLTFFALLVSFTVVIWFYITGKMNTKTFSLLILIILAIDIYVIWYNQNNGSRNPEKIYSQNSQTAANLKEELKREQFRINMREGGYMIFQRNQGMIDRLPLTEGYGALLLQKFIPVSKGDDPSQAHDLMNVKYKIKVDKNSQSMRLEPNPGYIPRAKMYYDVKVYKDEEQLKKYMSSQEFDYRKTLVIEKDIPDSQFPVLDSNSLVNSDVKMTNYSLNRIEFDVNTSETGMLYLSEVYYPAWKAYIDGKETEIYRADYCMRAIYISKGNHKVVFEYDSDIVKSGSKISFAFTGIWIIGLAVSIIRYRKGNLKAAK